MNQMVMIKRVATVALLGMALTGKFRSVFDVELTQQGTYRLATINNGLSANWEEDGKPKRWRGTPVSSRPRTIRWVCGLSVFQ